MISCVTYFIGEQGQLFHRFIQTTCVLEKLQNRETTYQLVGELPSKLRHLRQLQNEAAK